MSTPLTATRLATKPMSEMNKCILRSRSDVDDILPDRTVQQTLAKNILADHPAKISSFPCASLAGLTRFVRESLLLDSNW